MMRQQYQWFHLLYILLLLTGCTPTPTGNVLGFLLAEQTGSITAPPPPQPSGTLTGLVLTAGQPLAGATVLVAERTGKPHAARTDDQGRYTITGVPAGQYVPAATAPGYDDVALADALGVPLLVTIQPGSLTAVPTITLPRHQPVPLPENLAQTTHLTLTATAVLTAAFPAGSMARMQAFQFVQHGVLIDTLRLYLPLTLPADARLPLLFMIYPTHVDLWHSVSTAYAAQGYALVAISPSPAHGTDVAAHAAVARVAFALVQQGALSPQIDSSRTVALGGSFSSAILHRFLDDVGSAVAGWVTVGGISDAFRGTADFYAGKLEIPRQYRLLIPALGLPDLYPLPFLRYSPVYTASALPPTLIIHTAVDKVIPIEQAYGLEQALRAAGVPVEVFYYEDVSHYLQIDDQMTDQGRAMFYQVLEFAEARFKAASG
jgi:dipeptidyl aminopeptidase/acylaminoacyl peptidase